MRQSEFLGKSLGGSELACGHLLVGTFSDPCCLLSLRRDAISTDSSYLFVSSFFLSRGLVEWLCERERSRYASALRSPSSESPSSPSPELQFFHIHPRKVCSAWSGSQNNWSILSHNARLVPDGGCGWVFLSSRSKVSAS